MSNPMMFSESSSKNSRRVHQRRDRKMWKKPIKISRLPSFGFSGSDFTVDQIPAIFSGYTAESEDSSSSSSSSEMSDDSRTYSKSSDENEHIDQESSRSVKRRAKLKSVSSMKVLRRQSTRKLHGGGQRLKKMRSLKRLTSNSTHKNLDSISRDGFGLLKPHYLRPTSSSASKNIESNQKNLGVARLKRIASLRYNGLLKATCSSAMKGSSSKKSNDVCTYRYCSLHGRRHSHATDNNVGVPSLKRFVSMRRKFMKRQNSVNRRLVLLKRTLSRKRGPLGGGIVTDQESKEVDDNADGESNEEVFEEEVSSSENGGDNSESNGRSSETVMVDVEVNEEGGMVSMDTVASANKQWVQESKTEIMDDSDGIINKDLKENAAQWHNICEQTVMGLDHEEVKSEETVGDNEKVFREGSSLEMREEDGKKTVGDNNEEVFREGSFGEMREEDVKKTVDVWNETVSLVKQAFDEILAEITDDDSSDDTSVTKDEPLEDGLPKEDDVGADSSDSSSSDMHPTEGRDNHLSVIVSAFHMESDHQRGPKKWTYLKRVILLKRFLKSLDRREKRKLSNGEDRETIMRLRRELVGERKNAEEWIRRAYRAVSTILGASLSCWALHGA
ncbi:PREDICTED: uncharacterized protein LOC104737827 [Camelina sativa]|uniref:Uncharacterized protein LOC104737827 n=1 Tax=Camelina sativa TaxID=90675 RepID=A0ABM0VHW3_CAMSA|nr:PREDICTED: uncharacterized protein LOC104737827 [Camelina sativa]